MGWRRKHGRAPRCSIKLYRQAHDRGLKAFADYLKVCGVPPTIQRRRVKRQRVKSAA